MALKMRCQIIEGLFDALLIGDAGFRSRAQPGKERVAEGICGEEAVNVAAHDAFIR